jgi:hypothetical protein
MTGRISMRMFRVAMLVGLTMVPAAAPAFAQSMMPGSGWAKARNTAKKKGEDQGQ